MAIFFGQSSAKKRVSLRMSAIVVENDKIQVTIGKRIIIFAFSEFERYVEAHKTALKSAKDAIEMAKAEKDKNIFIIKAKGQIDGEVEREVDSYSMTDGKITGTRNGVLVINLPIENFISLTRKGM